MALADAEGNLQLMTWFRAASGPALSSARRSYLGNRPTDALQLCQFDSRPLPPYSVPSFDDRNGITWNRVVLYLSVTQKVTLAAAVSPR